MVERTIDWEIISLALVVTLIIMGGIYFLGQGLNDYKLDSIRNDIKDIEVDQRSQELGFQLAQNTEGRSCTAMRQWIEASTPEIRDLREKVAAYESSSKFNSPEYTLLKKRYTNLVIQNMLEVKTMERTCDKNVMDVVYIYSKYDCGRCEDQGTVLTYYRRKYSDQIIVYPIDSDLEMRSIGFMEDLYNITEYPALVIDGEVYKGFQSKQEMGEIIGSDLNETNSTDALVVNDG